MKIPYEILTFAPLKNQNHENSLGNTDICTAEGSESLTFPENIHICTAEGSESLKFLKKYRHLDVWVIKNHYKTSKATLHLLRFSMFLKFGFHGYL